MTTKSEELEAQEVKFGRCPKGHRLPYRTQCGNCTPLFCAGIKARTNKVAGNSGMTTVNDTTKELAAQGDLGPEAQEALTRIAKQETRFQARMAYVKLPKFSDPKAREKWVEDKKQELVPLALADVEYSLRLGDQQEREKARREVLDMTGHGKRESGGGSTSPLIILTGITGAPGDNPWVRRLAPDGKELPANVQVVDLGGKK